MPECEYAKIICTRTLTPHSDGVNLSFAIFYSASGYSCPRSKSPEAMHMQVKKTEWTTFKKLCENFEDFIILEELIKEVRLNQTNRRTSVGRRGFICAI